MIFLSFDIASRSLAFTIMKYNTNFLSDLKLLVERNNNIAEIYKCMDESISIRICDVVDLNEGKKNSEITLLQKTKKLKEVLTTLSVILLEFSNLNPTENISVLLEYQMSANYQANVIFNQIFYHFVDFEPKVISPCYKNKVFFSEELRYSKFTSNYANSYSANKAHTKANFLYFLKSFNMSNSITHIKKKNLDDAADSFMQIFAYINYYLKKNQN